MAGRVAAAQLRSQSGKGALLWMDALQGLAAMHTLQAVTMVLMAIMVDPWAISVATSATYATRAQKARQGPLVFTA